MLVNRSALFLRLQIGIDLMFETVAVYSVWIWDDVV
jgi:hypothetical protein